MRVLHRAVRLLGIVGARHHAGSVTGWSCLSRVAPAVFDDFSRPRITPLGIFPMEADFAGYRHPYSPKDTAA